MIAVQTRSWAAALVTLAGVAALAAVLAHWGWRWLGPATGTVPDAAVGDVAAALALSPPFGTPGPDVAAPAPPAPAAPAGAMRLLGLLSERDGGGRALLRLPDGTPRLVAVGDAVGDAETLAAVHADGITLRGAGGERRIDLRAQAPVSGAAAPSARRDACVPPGYGGPVVRLNAELVAGLIAQPETLAAVAEARDGALVVREATGFAAMLGLRKGDRVQQANGIALRTPDDIVIAVLRPLQASQAVRLTGLRGSEPQELLIVNAGACS